MLTPGRPGKIALIVAVAGRSLLRAPRARVARIAGREQLIAIEPTVHAGKLMYKDWRGTEIKVGSLILYAGNEQSNAFVTEAVVDQIKPREYLEKQGAEYPFHLMVTPLRRSRPNRLTVNGGGEKELRRARLTSIEGVTVIG